MNNQKILDNAPEGATHVDNEGDYWLMHPDNQVETFMDGSWLYCNPQEPLRSLADIKHIAELEKEVVKANMKLIDCALDIAELEKERIKLLSCLLGISNECIGEIAMNYRLDAQMIGESIYAATGKTNPELAKALKEQGE